VFRNPFTIVLQPYAEDEPRFQDFDTAQLVLEASSKGKDCPLQNVIPILPSEVENQNDVLLPEPKYTQPVKAFELSYVPERNEGRPLICSPSSFSLSIKTRTWMCSISAFCFPSAWTSRIIIQDMASPPKKCSLMFGEWFGFALHFWFVGLELTASIRLKACAKEPQQLDGPQHVFVAQVSP